LATIWVASSRLSSTQFLSYCRPVQGLHRIFPDNCRQETQTRIKSVPFCIMLRIRQVQSEAPACIATVQIKISVGLEQILRKGILRMPKDISSPIWLLSMPWATSCHFRTGS
jgi:hypothetical protein